MALQVGTLVTNLHTVYTHRQVSITLSESPSTIFLCNLCSMTSLFTFSHFFVLFQLELK